MAAQHPRRLLTIAHSFCVGLNRRLAHEIARAGGEQWEVTAVAPRFFHGDLRPIPLEAQPGELCRVVAVNVHLSRVAQLFFYGLGFRAVMRERWDLVHCWEEPYVVAGGQVALLSPAASKLVFYTFQNIAKHHVPPLSTIERMCVERSAGWLASGETLFGRSSSAAGAATLSRDPLGSTWSSFVLTRKRAVRRMHGLDPSGRPPVVSFSPALYQSQGLDC